MVEIAVFKNSDIIMSTLEEARETMIKSQLMAVGVRNASVLEAFRSLDMEAFLPEEFKLIAYSGKEIAFNKARTMLEPMVMGKFLQHTDILPTFNILTVGDVSGYISALLSKMAKSVTLLETDEFVEIAKSHIEAAVLEENNISFASGDITKGAAQNGPYDLIVFCGAVKKFDDCFYNQLSNDGAIIAAVKRGYICDAVCYHKGEDGSIQKENFFECSAGLLPEFKPKSTFIL